MRLFTDTARVVTADIVEPSAEVLHQTDCSVQLIACNPYSLYFKAGPDFIGKQSHREALCMFFVSLDVEVQHVDVVEQVIPRKVELFQMGQIDWSLPPVDSEFFEKQGLIAEKPAPGFHSR